MPIPGVTAVAQKIATRIGDLVHRIVRTLLRPASASILATAVLDLSRSKADLIAGYALLRHQLALLKRQTKRPKLSPTDRLHLLLLAKITQTWRQVLMIVQPATLLRWLCWLPKLIRSQMQLFRWSFGF